MLALGAGEAPVDGADAGVEHLVQAAPLQGGGGGPIDGDLFRIGGLGEGVERAAEAIDDAAEKLGSAAFASGDARRKGRLQPAFL